jgi:hypothetical protein
MNMTRQAQEQIRLFLNSVFAVDCYRRMTMKSSLHWTVRGIAGSLAGQRRSAASAPFEHLLTQCCR